MCFNLSSIDLGQSISFLPEPTLIYLKNMFIIYVLQNDIELLKI